jgi:hypothetical protein
LNSFQDLFIFINTAFVTIKDLVIPVRVAFYNAPIENIGQIHTTDLVLSIIITLAI